MFRAAAAETGMPSEADPGVLGDTTDRAHVPAAVAVAPAGDLVAGASAGAVGVAAGADSLRKSGKGGRGGLP
jgi:hypothetical protein